MNLQARKARYKNETYVLHERKLTFEQLKFLILIILSNRFSWHVLSHRGIPFYCTNDNLPMHATVTVYTESGTQYWRKTSFSSNNMKWVSRTGAGKNRKPNFICIIGFERLDWKIEFLNLYFSRIKGERKQKEVKMVSCHYSFK